MEINPYQSPSQEAEGESRQSTPVIRAFLRRALSVALYFFAIVGVVRILPTILFVVMHFDRLGDRAVPYLAGYLGTCFVLFFLASTLWRDKSTKRSPTSDHRRNLVTFTPNAVQAAQAMIAERGIPDDAALRLTINRHRSPIFAVQFDLPSDGDSDWVGESLGMTVVVDKSIAEHVNGLVVDAENGQFVFSISECDSKVP